MFCAKVIVGMACCCLVLSANFDIGKALNGGGLQGENLDEFLDKLQQELENSGGGNGNNNGNGNVHGGNSQDSEDDWPRTNGANSTGEANGLNNTGNGNGNNNDGGYNGNNNAGNFNGNNNKGGYNGNNNGGSGNGNGNSGGSNGNGNGFGNVIPDSTPGKFREAVKELAADDSFVLNGEQMFSSASTLFLAQLSMFIIVAVFAF